MKGLLTAIRMALCAAGTLLAVSAAETQGPQFVDITRQAGIAFQTHQRRQPRQAPGRDDGIRRPVLRLRRRRMGGHVSGDGGSIADPAVARRAGHRLYHNRGNGTFEDVSARSGIRHSAYGMGACSGDYDGDGRVPTST